MSVVLCCGAVLVSADEVQCKLNVRASGGDVAKFSQCAAKHTFLLDDFIRGMTVSLLEIGPAALLSFFFVFPLFRDWLGNVSLDGSSQFARSGNSSMIAKIGAVWERVIASSPCVMVMPR